MILCMQVLAWCFVNGLTFLAAARITALNDAGSRSMTLTLWVFWWIFIDTSIVLLLGMAGWLNPWVITLVAVSLAGATGACSSANMRFVIGLAKDIGAAARILWAWHPLYVTVWTLMLTVIVARMWMFVVGLPPHVYDVLTYHLPKVTDWIQEGRLVFNDTPVDRSFWPAGFELFQVWFAIFWHHDVLIEAAGIPYYMLAVGGVYCLARCLSVRRVYAAWSAMMYATTPIVVMNAVSCKNDVPLAALLILATVLLVSLFVEKSKVGAQLVTFAAVVGLGMGIKAFMVFVFPVLALALVLIVRRRRHDVFCRCERFELVALCAIISMSVLLAGYWYIRNWVVFDNPAYPVPLNLLGNAMPGIGGIQQGKFSLHSMLESFKAIWERRLWDRGPYDPDACFITGWGWYVVGVGLASSLFAMCVNKAYRWIWISFALCLCLVLGFVTPDPWNMRFVQWYPAIMCVACGVNLQSLRSDLIRRSLLLLAALCGMLNLAGSLNNGWFSQEDWRKHLSVPWRQKSIQEIHTMIDKRVPRGEPLAYIVGGNDPVYCLYGPDMERRIRYIRLGGIGFQLDSPDYRVLVIQSGCRYFYFPRSEEGARSRNLFSSQVGAGWFTDLGGDVYKVSHAK